MINYNIILRNFIRCYRDQKCTVEYHVENIFDDRIVGGYYIISAECIIHTQDEADHCHEIRKYPEPVVARHDPKALHIVRNYCQ